jgi:hypothetical protein
MLFSPPTPSSPRSAALKAAAVDRKEGPAPSFAPGMQRLQDATDQYRNRADDRGNPGPFAPGLKRFNDVMNRRSDPDDTANDPSLMPGFNAANRHYEDSHMHSHAPAQPPQPGVPSGKPRGFQIHKVQAAAQAAKGNQYNGPDDDGAD